MRGNKMDKKFKASEIHLKIDKVIPCVGGLLIEWSSDIGFGEYAIYQCKDDPNQWCADSECMDINEDKEFTRELMKLFVEQLDIRN